MKKPGKALSGRVKALREKAEISQQELATRADLSLSQVAKLEQGSKADPRASTLLALARGLGVRPGELLDDLVPPAKPREETASPEAGKEVCNEACNGAEGTCEEPKSEAGKKKKKKGKEKAKKVKQK